MINGKGQHMLRLPPQREYMRLTFEEKRAVIDEVYRLLTTYAETERPTT